MLMSTKTRGKTPWRYDAARACCLPPCRFTIDVICSADKRTEIHALRGAVIRFLSAGAFFLSLGYGAAQTAPRDITQNAAFKMR